MLRPSLARLIALALALAAAPCAAADAPSLRFLGSLAIPQGTRMGDGVFGGISALERAEDGTYFALSDDRGGAGRAPRFYRLDIALDEGGPRAVTILGEVPLRRPDGAPFPAEAPTVDPEGLRLAPEGGLYISSEGNFDDDSAALHQPFLREFGRDGAHRREFALPDRYAYVDGETTGGRDNELLEALAVGPDGVVWVANEGPLAQDGPPLADGAGGPVRITAFEPETGAPAAQYVHRLPEGGFGLTELLALEDGTLLALERRYVAGEGNTVHVVRLTVPPEATEVLDMPALAEADYTPVAREALLTVGPRFEGVRHDNLEGMAFGPKLADGTRTLILVSDDNFNPLGQRTLFLAFALEGAPD